MIIEQVKEGFLLVVDYGKSIAELINGADCDYVSRVVNDDNFPQGDSDYGRKERHFALYDFGSAVEERYVVWRISHDNRSPAGIRDLLWLANVQSKSQLQRYPLIVSMGSVLKNKSDDSVPCLNHTVCDGDVRRSITLRLRDGWWEEGCHFLAVNG